jgi:hypothetical protein
MRVLPSNSRDSFSPLPAGRGSMPPPAASQDAVCRLSRGSELSRNRCPLWYSPHPAICSRVLSEMFIDQSPYVRLTCSVRCRNADCTTRRIADSTVQSPLLRNDFKQSLQKGMDVEQRWSRGLSRFVEKSAQSEYSTGRLHLLQSFIEFSDVASTHPSAYRMHILPTPRT